MNYSLIHKRGSVNVEYILLIVLGALAVVLGLQFLNTVMLSKHIEVAEGLNLLGGQGQQVAAALVVEDPVDNGSGALDLTWSGGKPPYQVSHSLSPDMAGSILTTTTTHVEVTVAPDYGDNYYVVTDSGGSTSDIIRVAYNPATKPAVYTVTPMAFEVYQPSTDKWSAASSLGRPAMPPMMPTLAFAADNRVFAVSGTRLMSYQPPSVSGMGTWTVIPPTINQILRPGADSAVNTNDGVVYLSVAGSQPVINWFNYTDNTENSMTVYVSGVATRLRTGSAITYAPHADRLFVINDGYLFDLASPGMKTGNQEFAQSIAVGLGYWNRMTAATIDGEDYLFILGNDTLQVVSQLDAATTITDLGTYPFAGALGEGADLEWDGASTLYAVRGDNTTEMAHITIPSDPTTAANWNSWTHLTTPYGQFVGSSMAIVN